MAFNQFMHPRNIYREKPNFKEMAEKFPEFGSHVIYLDDDDSNKKRKATIDYQSIDSLKVLTKTLMKKDFNLDIEIPEQRLVPTLPMRLNYILWIEDLLHHCSLYFDITGIDIGTGSCAIFPLLATIMNKDWKFFATDIDLVNLEYANLNVKKNNLQNRIKIIQNKSQTIFKNVIENNPDEKFNFLMTNPPFFEDTFNDSFDNSKIEMSSCNSTYHNRKTNSACSIEAIYDGGELQFIKKIIEESFDTKIMIDFYTAMIGRKKTFLELKCFLKELLENKQIASFTYTELCQGNTKRWAIAWTFVDKFDLAKAPRISSNKGKPLIHYINQDIKACDYDIKSIAGFIKKLLINDLNIETFDLIETKKRIEFDIKSNECSWKNQRKKRREQQQQIIRESQLQNSESGDSPGCSKRMFNEKEEIYSNYKNGKKHKNLNELFKTDLTYSLHCGLTIKRDKQEIYIKMLTKEMSQNKETTYQLYQYFKNKLQ